MMNLKTQIIVILFSFFYGIFFSFLLEVNQKWLYQSKRWVRYLITCLFVFVNVLFFFWILQKINYGIIHIYSFLLIIGGYVLETAFHKRIAKRFKK